MCVANRLMRVVDQLMCVASGDVCREAVDVRCER